VAVTVQQRTPLVVLDEGDRIVEVGPGAQSQFGPQVGSVVWDCYPGSEPLFKPYYDNARRTGDEIEFVQFYDGNVARVRAVPRADSHLELYWEHLAQLDTLTIGTLVDSLEQSLEVLEGASTENDRTELRKALRVIEGGGA
jgi:hypothetical protein